MNEHRRQILNMLAANKINAEEAERLLAAVESSSAAAAEPSTHASGTANPSPGEAQKSRAKYLRVQVVAKAGKLEAKGPVTVNLRVPMQLLRAGVRLASLIPVQAHEHLDEAFRKHGVPMTLSQIKPENLEALVEHLDDLTMDFAAQEGNSDVNVKVFSE